MFKLRVPREETPKKRDNSLLMLQFFKRFGWPLQFFFENSNFTTLQRVWLESPFIFLTFLQMGKVAFSAYSVDLGVPSSNNVM